MTLADLIATYRTDANDKVQPYFASDEEVTGWLNEAVVEAAIRGRLIHESDDASICRIAVSAGNATYKLHASLYEITHIAYREAGGTSRCELRLVSTEYLDSCARNWRDSEGAPKFAVQGDIRLRLVPRPVSDGELLIEGYRTPKRPLELDDKEAEPEILALHHRHLVDWALYRGFSVPDTESFDPERAEKSLYAFERYFGLRPDSDLRRQTREDVPHTVQPSWP